MAQELQELVYLKEACKYKLRSDCDGPSELKTVSLSRIACDNLVNNDGATIYNSDEKSDISYSYIWYSTGHITLRNHKETWKPLILPSKQR